MPFKNILDRIGDGVIALDKDWRYGYLNKKAEEIAGKSRQELTGKIIWDVYGFMVDSEFYNACREAMQSQREIFIESSHYQDAWYEIFFYPSAEELTIHFRDITERKKAQEETKRYNERLKTVSGAIYDSVWEWNLETGELWANEAHRELYDMQDYATPANVAQWMELIHPDDREKARKPLEDALNNNLSSWEIEYRFRRKTGGYATLFNRCFAIRNKEGKVVRFIGTIIDITTKKKAEEEIKRYNERFEMIARAVHDGIWENNLETGEIWANEAHQNLFGLTQTDPVPTVDEWVQRIHPDDRSEAKTAYDVALMNGVNYWESEYRFLKNTGEYITIFDRSYVIRNSEGKAIRLTGTMIDITERKKAEAEIVTARELADKLIDGLPGIFNLVDEDGNFIRWNSQHELATGYSAAELAKMKVYDLLVEKDKELIRRRIRALFENENGNDAEATLVTKNGEKVPYYFKAVRLSYQDKPCFIVYGVDISERKRAEAEIIKERELSDRLIESLPGVFYFFDDKGKMLRWNKQAEAVTGYSTAEMAAMNPADFFTGETKDRVIEKIYEGFEKGESHIEADFTTKTGQFIPYYFKSIMMMYDGRPCLVGTGIDISERKKAEAGTIKERELADTLIDSLPGIFYFFDHTGKFIRWNKQLETVTGYTSPEVTNMHPLDFFTGVNKKHIEKKVAETFEKGMADSEADVTIKSGEAIPYYFKCVRLIYDGKPCVVGAAIDISERKKAEAAIIRERELADNLIDSLPGVFYLFDHTGKMIRWNRQLEIVTGYSAEEITNMHPSQFFTGEAQQYISKKIMEVFEKGEADAEADFTTKSGEQLPYFFKGVRLMYEGKPCLIGKGINIAERKKAEAEIIKARELADKLVDSLPGTFYLFDNTGKLLRWNRQLEIVTGYSAEEVENMQPVDFFPAELQPMIVQKITQAFETGEVDVEADVITKQGQLIPYFFKAARIFYNEKPCVVGTGTDITERVLAQKKLEDSFKEIRELTEHLQNIREEERTHIAREIHDELGQQLTVLKMDVSWLNKKVQGDEAVKLRLKDLTSMLDNTVKSVRRISSELRPSLLDDLGLVAAMDWQLRDFEKRTGIKTVLKEPESDIEIPDSNITGLFRIFQESLTNVARHAEAKKVVVSLRQSNGRVILNIEDNGKGFDKQKAGSKRTLGILGMKERTLMMGGHYEISSEPGKGTTVVVSVPATKQASIKS